MEFRDAIENFAEQPITKQILLEVLRGYKRPYDKIAELVKQGMLILVKRGIYVPGANLKIAEPELFLLANHLLGPSYVSVETALAYWGFIPEKVYEISSVTTQNSKIYNTAIGRFGYTHLPLPYYAFGIQQVELTSKQVVLMASPEKALCDKIICTSGIQLRSTRQVKEFLMDDLRIDNEVLRNMRFQEIEKWIHDSPKNASLTMLVKTIQEL